MLRQFANTARGSRSAAWESRSVAVYGSGVRTGPTDREIVPGKKKGDPAMLGAMMGGWDGGCIKK